MGDASAAKIKLKGIYMYQFARSVLWPDEFSTWTNAAVIIAADCVFGISKKRNVFLA